jgi:Protein of unknown function (DUF3054)
MAAVNPQELTSSGGAGRIAGLVVGDLITFLLFAAVGRASHAEAAGLDAIAQVAETAAPFAIGWFLVAPFVGAYREDVTGRPGRMLSRAALAWLIACPVGLVLRALIRQTGIPWTFALVTFLTVLVMVGIWRGAYALVAQRARRT